MRHNAPFVVKRLAPLLGQPDTPRRISVEYQAYTVAHALSYATHAQRVLRSLAHVDSYRSSRTQLWIEKRHQPATRPKAQR